MFRCREFTEEPVTTNTKYIIDVASKLPTILLDETFNTPAKDREIKVVLASMEMKLRKCLDCMKDITE